ncbi:MAG: phosphoribosylglycinamide formyltransferase [Lachnospiraceae bacterium]|nr:phosphoribosylglycinamide formyltransferase [Lachnospiraceae bacterium]
MRIGVLVSGGGTNLHAIIYSISEGRLTNTEIAVVISNNEGAYALERARKAGIKAQVVSPKNYPTRDMFNYVLVRTLDGYDLDLIVLAGFLVKIPPALIKRYPGRIINIHPSLIPSFCGVGYYGLRVHEAALARGVKITGATVHIVDEDMDTGPILLQKAVEVKKGDTPELLQRRVMEEAEWKLLPQAIQLFADGKVDV